MKLTFLGAAQTVTGSKYLLEHDGRRVMVDCGLFQGRKELRERNWEDLPFPAADIDAILLTHAHLDHSGYIPRLVRAGFNGPIYCSAATRDLCKIILTDSAHIQEEDAAAANRHGYSKHQPALPLYTKADVEAAMTLFRVCEFAHNYTLHDELRFSLHRAGHILGAAFIRVDDGQNTILFSGDIGRPHSPIMKPPSFMDGADYLVLESTYGDRLHESGDPADELETIIRRTAARGGSVVIPAFAVGRAQTILYHISTLKRDGRIPADIPVYLDSPMAIDTTDLLCAHMNEHRLNTAQCHAVGATARTTRTAEESKAINAANNNMPKIIVSASGMATGGRVLHHLKHFLGDPRSTIVLAGFQAPGTRGERLAMGEDEIKIHGQMWPVKAEIIKLDTMSAHADYAEILEWLGHFQRAPRRVFITHGEPAAAAAMKQHIEDKFGWDVAIPAPMDTEEF